jgi:phosphoglycolate phosphatase-like HAD superfamily hydrolase
MTDLAELDAFRPTKPCFVGIDSDGCAFDSMEIKWKECFIPRAIEHFGLQPVAKYARTAIEFVNLYSQSRGTNRFFGVLESLDWLAKHPEVAARGFTVPACAALRAFAAGDPQPTEGKLAKLHAAQPAPDLGRALAWSQAVNADIKRMVHGIPPFPRLKECLEKLSAHADILVVSSTPKEALVREWTENGIARYVTFICGQETGSKKQMLAAAAKGYARERVLMIGDAPGDHKAAAGVQARFWPIVPGAEEASWALLEREGLDRFLAGSYRGSYEDRLIADFQARLPARPAWVAG